ncbi:GNAT family N-acetyltransferase [Chelatococcus sambhunathii]|uniref:GNAT family N-acetyltransferase n=1 Tax=Chelatococcus sambhunathii TaxID=363953 RepID=A0ABU1DJH9_9HYPH|nr:GNAT family N-acetyltransferase [Chelatococcus sambhunathii]MDR4308283.1 GNAT family N-acetyltransferase [Chelatococcus sambhunathii]
MTVEIAAPEEPNQDDRAAILRGLVAFNNATYGPSDIRPLAVLLREGGETVGGLWGRTSYGWLFIELLFVPEIMRGRGLGATLIKRAEDIARGRGCANAWIDCFGEPNRRFYERRGFAVFGSMPDHPDGVTRYFLRKKL